MNWNPCFIVMMCVVIQAGVSSLEGTFSPLGTSLWNRRQVDMPFSRHPAMWADFFILSWMAGIVWPYLRVPNFLDSPVPILISIIVVSLFVTLWMHRMWRHEVAATDHIFPKKEWYWTSDISLAGMCHVIFMTAGLTMLTVFVLTPNMPPLVIFLVGGLTCLFFIPLVNMGPSMVLNGRVDTLAIQATAIMEVITIVGLLAKKVYW